jgi:Fanconi anemia group M protein
VLATPQVIRNDVLSGTLPLHEFSLLVFDEAHRATGDYPYVTIATKARGLGARVLGITASPGSRIERIREVMENLGISPHGLEFRGESDPDVLPYMHDILFEPVYVDKPKEVEIASSLLKSARNRQVEALASYYAPIRGQEMVTKTLLLDAGRAMGAAISQHRALGTKVPAAIWQAQRHQAVAMKIVHALELMETQGVPSLELYVKRMAGKTAKLSPSTREFLSDPEVRAALDRVGKATGEHPKIAKVVELVKEGVSTPREISPEGDRGSRTSRVIVFAHYRDTAEMLVKRLSELHDPGIRPIRFVGQATRDASDKGLSQKEQVAILEAFRSGQVNCLVATSVAEEGLDIPSTDLVIFYEPVPSEIRTIQRRGRTGRSRAGRVVVLLTRGTQDVGSFFSAKGKERKMRELIERLRGASSRITPAPIPQQSTLDGYAP